MTTRLPVVLVAAALVAGAVAGCATPAPAPNSTPTSSAVPVTGPVQGPAITITALNFGDPLTVAPGAQVTVVNSDDVAHTVTSKVKGQFDVKVGGNAQTTFNAPTTPVRYPYYCVYHPGMVGVLIVQ
ncbi:cupredoxin domain-containing protein [Mycolicibacterium phocaicum]|jgi:plastocyanin|uniref:Plastocyanin n=1 Tax=Mycolicibacterium phocaicum TaxID=319706 RepID=A0A7I7ZJM3_9MYCO|nr:plastocyanin [Mycolicibacterium phocaicum]TLH67657.1 plastocyanin [Mycolicibacterium phocaicum]BBZ53597.1 metal-binding protein [Mycolicibacterium phocaicum]